MVCEVQRNKLHWHWGTRTWPSRQCHNCFEWDNTSVSDSREAKALSVVRTTAFAREIGLQNFIIEGNSLSMIPALSSTKPSLSKVGYLLDNAKEKAILFGRVVFQCTSKDWQSRKQLAFRKLNPCKLLKAVFCLQVKTDKAENGISCMSL